jgi:hypothetical protein
MIPEVIIQDFKYLDTYMQSGSRSMAAKAPVEGFDPAIMIGERITQDTDWDFNAPANAENHHALLAAGYTHFNRDQLVYVDALCQGIYVKNIVSANALDITSVQVVLRSDYWLFRETWYSIDPQFYYNYIWKRSPCYRGYSNSEVKERIRDIMNQLFTTAKAMA